MRAVFQQTFNQIAYEDMLALMKPAKSPFGLQDHEKVFCVDHKATGDIFCMRVINRDEGCMVVVRPDQYIAHILPLDANEELASFVDNILAPAALG